MAHSRLTTTSQDAPTKGPKNLPERLDYNSQEAQDERDTKKMLAGIASARKLAGKPSSGAPSKVSPRSGRMSYSTAAALVAARAMKRLAGKYGDLSLARRAKELNREAHSALRMRKPVLSDQPLKNSERPNGQPGRRQVAQEQDEDQDDPTALRYAAEHKWFLQENNPSVLSGQSDPTSYLYSVGSQAARRLEHLMALYSNSPEVQKLPHLARVRALQNRQFEVEEVIRHDLIYQPLPE